MPNDMDTNLPQSGLADDCAPCGLHRPMRNAYYDGKMLTARDLTAEQSYMNGMRHLGNMMLEGGGTVCGLKVVQHPQEDCRDSHLVLQAGMALSCCGQEIVVPTDVTIPVLEMLRADPDLQEALSDGTNELVVQLCRDDKAAEMGPVLISDCCSGLDGQLPSRIAEDFGFMLKAQPKGSVTGARAVLEPDLNWVHSINTGDETPTVVAVDEESDLVFVASQADHNSETKVAAIRAYSMTTHRHVATLQGWSAITDVVTPSVGNWMFVAGLRDGSYQIATYPRNPDHRDAPEFEVKVSGPAKLAVSPVTGALFALEYNIGNRQPTLTAWSAEQIEGRFAAHSFQRSKRQAMDTTAFDAGCRVIDVSSDGQRLAYAMPGPWANTVRVARVSDVLSGTITALDGTSVRIDSELGVNLTEAYATTAAIAFSYDGEVLHCVGRDPDARDRAVYRAVSISETGYTQLGGGLGFEFPDVTGLQPAVFVAPDERWIYVTTATDVRKVGRGEDGRIWAFDTRPGQAPGTEVVEGSPLATVPLTADTGNGAIRLRGQRLYVCGVQSLGLEEDEVSGPTMGRVMVVDITEADIKGLFEEAVEGCTTCGEACSCVTLAHLPNYVYDAENPMRMVDAGTGLEGEAEIDNLTYRHIVPSNTKLMEAILEIAARGVDAGPPGARGRDGDPGLPGANGTDGDDGAGIVAVSYGDVGDPELRPEGGVGPNLELILPFPDLGSDGTPGERGGSIEQVVYDSGIDAPVTTPIAGDPEGDVTLALPVPIENVVYRSVPTPRMGNAPNEDRTLILPNPVAGEDGTDGGGTPPRDPSDYQHVQSFNWTNGAVYSLANGGNRPRGSFRILLSMDVSNPEVLFTDVGSGLSSPVSLETFSGVIEVRVHLHDFNFSLDPPEWNGFEIERVKTLRYAPTFTRTEDAFLNDRTIVLGMSDLWQSLENYWDKQTDASGGGRARIEILLHGHFLRNEDKLPFDGRDDPNVEVELAGQTGGTWRSWFDVVDS